MRRLKGLFLLAASLVAFGHATSRTTPLLQWKNIAPRYSNFAEIRPILLNLEGRSIFLSRLWPNGYAQLERYNESTQEWELGEWGITCGTVQAATVPIEIKAGSEYDVHIDWQVSSDDWNHPRHFVVHETLEERPMAGKYKLMLRYALKPWTLFQQPGPIYVIESPEFTVSS